MENEEKSRADEAYAKHILDAFMNAPLSTELNLFQLKEIALITCQLMHDSHHPSSGARVFLCRVHKKLSQI
jgi:hypothetical protein